MYKILIVFLGTQGSNVGIDQPCIWAAEHGIRIVGSKEVAEARLERELLHSLKLYRYWVGSLDLNFLVEIKGLFD